MAWSPYKDSVVNYVKNNPGCSKLEVAYWVTRNRNRNPNKQYHIVNTAIRHGWIKAESCGNKYKLYPVEVTK